MDDPIRPYNDSAAEYAKSRIGTEDTEEIERFSADLVQGTRMLDVGCAAGRDTHIFKEMGFNVIGVDLADKLLRIGRETYPDITFVHGDMRALPFKDGSFDAIWASAVLHHAGKADMPTVLSEFWRVLPPGGILYIHTKSGEGQLFTTEEAVQGARRNFELVTAEELDALLVHAGFGKVSLDVKASRSRNNLRWINALYRKNP